MANKTPSYNPSISLTIKGDEIKRSIENCAALYINDYPIKIEVSVDGIGIIETTEEIEVEVDLDAVEYSDIQVRVNMMDILKMWLEQMGPGSEELFVRAAMAVAFAHTRQDWYSRGASDFMGSKDAE